jgi:hypothetical protein
LLMIGVDSSRRAKLTLLFKNIDLSLSFESLTGYRHCFTGMPISLVDWPKGRKLSYEGE